MPHLGHAIPALPGQMGESVPLAEGGKLVPCINTEFILNGSVVLALRPVSAFRSLLSLEFL